MKLEEVIKKIYDEVKAESGQRGKEKTRMPKVYAAFKGNKILKMSANKQELIEFRSSFPEGERKGTLIAEYITLGSKEHPYFVWAFEIPQEV